MSMAEIKFNWENIYIYFLFVCFSNFVTDDIYLFIVFVVYCLSCTLVCQFY